MAGKNMTFNASIRLNSKEFKKGIRDVQNSIKGLQRTFLSVAGALGAGLGFGKLVSDLKETAVALNSAEVTLKNVSTGFAEYGQNLDFIKKISEEYGQDQLALTQSFAKFRAAAAQTNLTIDQQRDIFESLTRAAGAYNMSSDQTRNTMMAVEQMLSKGRVAAEELRRQLGNALPGAFNLMAMAAGRAGITLNGTTAELEEAMKEGRVTAEKVLPSFAQVLNEVTQTANFNSLQNSMARLKNAWTELTRSSGFQDMFQGVIKDTTNFVKFFSKNMTLVKSLLTGAIAGIPLGTLWNNSLKKGAAYYDALGVRAEDLKKKTGSLGKEIEQLNKKYLEVLGKNQKGELFDVKIKGRKGAYFNEQLAKLSKTQTSVNVESADIQKVVEYNRLLAELEKTEKELGISTSKVSKEALRQSESLAQAAVKTEGYSAAVGKLTKVGKGFSLLWKSFKNIFATALSSMAVGAVIAGFVSLISYLSRLHKEAKALNNTVSDMEKKVKDVGESVGENKTAQKLTAIKIALEKINTEGEDINLPAKKNLLGELNKTLGRTGDELFTVESRFDDIAGAVDNYINKLKYAAMQQAIVATVGEKTAEILKLQLENQDIMTNPNYGATVTKGYGIGTTTWEEPTPQAAKLQKALDKNTTKIEKLNEGINNLLGPLAKNPDFVGPIPAWQANQDTLNKIWGMDNPTNTSGQTSGDTGAKAAKGAQKAFEDYTEAVEKLNNKYKEGLVTEKEYFTELFKLTKKAKEEAAESGELNIDSIIGKINSNKPLTKLEEWYQDLFHNGTIYAMKVLDYENEKLAAEFADDIDKELDKISQEELEKFQENLEKLNELKMPEFKGPETWDNYKQKDYEIWKENADALEDYAKDIKDLMDDLKKLGPEGAIAFDNLKGKLEELSNTAKTLRDKARVEEWKEDIKELQEQFGTDFYNSIKNVAQGFERLYDTFKDLQDRFDDAEGIEQVILAFETVFEVLETGMAIYETFKKLTETTTALQKAQGDLQMQNMQKELAMKGAITAADVAGATTAAEAGAVKIATAHATANALKSVATAGAAANAMQVPYPGNLVALATNMAALAGALAAGKGFQAFKDGGIVNGPATGDRTLIRANGGEMMLNKSQQNDLWNFIKNGSQGFGGGQVDFKIRGADLVGTIKNYESRLRG